MATTFDATVTTYTCDDCGGEFAVTSERLTRLRLAGPFCPYCRSTQCAVLHNQDTKSVILHEPVSID